MQLIDRPGYYRTKPGAKTSIEAKDSGAVAVVFDFEAAQWYDETNKQWLDWEPYQLGVRGKVWVVKKDKEINKGAYENLLKTCGWDGDWSKVGTDQWQVPALQISVETKPDQRGKPKLEVSWINPFDSDPGARGRPATPEQIAALTRLYGSKMKAIAGTVGKTVLPPVAKPETSGAPSAAPGTPAIPPAPSAAPSEAPAPTPPIPDKPPASCSIDEAYLPFAAQIGKEKWTTETVNAEWFRIIKEMFPDKDPQLLTPSECARLRDTGPGMMIPF